MSPSSLDPTPLLTQTAREKVLEQKLEQKNAELKRRSAAEATLLRRLQVTRCKAKQRAKKLREQNKTLRARNAALQAAVSQASAYESGPLSAAQRRAAARGRRVRWSERDVGTALGLRCLSRRAYEYVKDSMKIPLPSLTTLSEWTHHFQMTPGVMESAMCVLEATVTGLDDMGRLCVVAFDEISLDPRVCYDQRRDEIMETSKMQLVMVRGLTSPWKQPVWFDFDQPMTPDKLCEVISRVEAVGLRVVAAVSDMAPTNERLWTELGITKAFSATSPHRTWFVNPVDPARCVLCSLLIFGCNNRLFCNVVC